MGKSKYTDREFDQIDKQKKQIKHLKRDLKRARKNLDRYAVAEEKGLIDEGVIIPGKKRQKAIELIEQWKCYECKHGVLKLIRIGNRYFRKCTNCDKHTKSQIWDTSVKGVE